MRNQYSGVRVNKSLRVWLLLNAVAYIMGAVTGIGYFTIGGIMAPVSDFMAIIIGLTFIPVTLLVARIFSVVDLSVAEFSRFMGLMGHIIFALSGLALVISYFSSSWFPEAPSFGKQAFAAQLVGIFLEGIWLFLLARLSRQAGLKTRFMVYLILAGAGNVLFVAGTAMRMPVVAGGMAFVGFIAYILWAFGFRKSLKG